VPILAALLSIPTGDRYAALDLSPQQQKDATVATLVNRECLSQFCQDVRRAEQILGTYFIGVATNQKIPIGNQPENAIEKILHVAARKIVQPLSYLA
jgi:hypothetical protein